MPELRRRYVAALEAGDGEAVRGFFAEDATWWLVGDLPTAGEPDENFCIGVFTLRDGRIAAVREYMDTAYAHRVAFG